MNNLITLVKNNPIIFGLVIFAFLLDITGVMSSIIPGAIFGLPSSLAVIYFLGITILVRFVIAKRPIHSAITWLLIIILYFGWFILMAALSDGVPYRPSILVWLCLFAAFKTIRFQPESAFEANTVEEENESNY